MSKHVAILTATLSENPFLSQWLNLKEAGKRYGIKVDLLKNGLFHLKLTGKEQQLTYNSDPFCPDQYSVYYNGIGTSAKHGGNFYIPEILHLQGRTVFNTPEKIELTRNKLRTLNLLSSNQIPITPTLIVRQPEDLLNVENYDIQFPMIVKRIFGSKGKSVMRVDDLFQLRALFDFAWNQNRNEILLIQPYIHMPNQPHEDIRVITLGGKVVASMMRYAAPGDFRTNFSLNRSVAAVTLTSEEICYCERISQIFGLNYAGIDFIRTTKGIYFLEVNGTPGFTGINQVYQQQHQESFFTRFIQFTLEELNK